MAWSYVAETVGTGNKTAGTGATASITASTGDILIALCICDAVTTSEAIGTSAVTDSVNTWTRKASNQALTGALNVAQAVFTTTVASTMSGTTVTFTPDSTVVAKNFLVMQFTGGSETVRGTTQTGNGSTTPYATLTHTGPVSGDLVLGFWGAEAPIGEAFTDDADTTNGSWSTSTSDFGTSGGTSTTNVRGQMQYKIVTATGTQTWNTSGNNRDYRNLLLALQPGAGGSSPKHSCGILLG